MAFPLRFVPLLALAMATTVLLPASARGDSDWPQFRGPGARGIADGQGLPATWSATENVAWKVDIAGRGWSSPIVSGTRVFVTTAVSNDEEGAPKKGLYLGGNRSDEPDLVIAWKVLCLDLEEGTILWDRTVHEGTPGYAVHVKNSYASETPVTDGKHVYAYFGNVGIFCLDFDGKEVWSKRFEPMETRFSWGTASSPVLHGDNLYLQRDFMKNSHVLALDKSTGEQVWRADHEEYSNWSTPFVWENEKRTEIVTAGSAAVRSYGLDGSLLWSLTGMSSITIAGPYEANGLLYISSGYVGDKIRPVYAIRPGASGDISLADSETSNEWIAWSNPEAGPYNPSTVIYDNRLYVLYDRGQMACFNAGNGDVIFGREKIPGARNFTASPWAYDGKVFCLNEDGETFVMEAGETLKLLHTNTLTEDDMGMATPAIAGDRLLIRTAARIYCIRDKARGTVASN